jgi:hypothetical protein
MRGEHLLAISEEKFGLVAFQSVVTLDEHVFETKINEPVATKQP